MSESPQADHAREESLAFSRAEAAEHQVKELLQEMRETYNVDAISLDDWADRLEVFIASFSSMLADRDHAREERDNLSKGYRNLLADADAYEIERDGFKADLHAAREELATLKATLAESWRKQAWASNEEGRRIHRTVKGTTDAETRCYARAEVWVKCAYELEGKVDVYDKP